MAALHSPFSGENMNLQILVQKIEKCEYPDLPEDLFTREVSQSQICQVATQMHQHFQAVGNMSPVTPSPMEMQQS